MTNKHCPTIKGSSDSAYLHGYEVLAKHPHLFIPTVLQALLVLVKSLQFILAEL